MSFTCHECGRTSGSRCSMCHADEVNGLRQRIAELEKSDRTNSLKVVMLCMALSAYKPREAIDDAMRGIDAICDRMDDGGYSDD